MIWFSIIIPVALTLFFYFNFKKQIVWWELFLSTAASLLVIVSVYEISIHSKESDVQYKGDLIVRAEYYESWETWVTQECHKTVCDEEDKNGHCTSSHTEYYDCSYCDYNREYYVAYLTDGSSVSISSKKFYELKARWGGTWEFHDQDRDIDFRGTCGKDGDMYSIKWNGDPKTSEPYTWIASYENRVQAAQSTFNYRELSDKRYLYEYPEVFDQFHQVTVLGIDSLNLPLSEKERILKRFEYLNGYYGPKKKVRVYVCLFYKPSQTYAINQEILWKGGNQNEIVVCIGVDRNTLELQWVKPFGWCSNKRVDVNLRENIMEQEKLNLDSVYSIVEQEILQNYHVTIFKEKFAYLQVKPSGTAIIISFILTFIISLGINIWMIQNEFTEASPGGSGGLNFKSRYGRY